jgi:hypothetical protein
VIEQSELERAIAFSVLPRHFSHSMPGRLNKVDDRTQCIPILLKREDQAPGDRWTTTYKNSGTGAENARTRALCFKALESLFATYSTQFAKFTSGQKLATASILKKGVADVKMRYMAAKSIRGRTIMSQPDWFERMAEGQKVGTSMHGIHEIWNSDKTHPDLTFAVVYDGYTVPGAIPGDVYAIFYTDQPGTLEALSHKLRYSMTDEKEIYSGPGADFKPSIFSPVLPAGTFGLPRACFTDPALFRSELRKILVSGLHIRELEPPECGTFAFNPDAYSYKGRTDNELERVCASLGAELGKSFRIRYKPAPVLKNFHVTNISWSSAPISVEDPC